MILMQITIEEVSILNAVGDGLQWVVNVMKLFLQVPAVYFVAFAVVGAVTGVSLKFISIKRK